MLRRQHDFSALRQRTLICTAAALSILLAVTPAWSASSSYGPNLLKISGTPASTVVATHAFTFTPTAWGSGGRTMTFTIAQMPGWATFNTSTGTLSGTPPASSVGTYSNILIGVRDQGDNTALSPFSIRVTPSQSSSGTPSTPAPTIAGSPARTVVAGQAYSFTPTTTAPGGATLSFSIQNKPAWGTFSIATGSLTGTPAAANVGTTSGIVISVSDSNGSASLPSFPIAVSPVVESNPTGTATLAWTAPTTNTNGSPLTNLAGYYLYDGPSPSSLTLVTTIANPAATTYTVNNIPTGTWYFTVVAYNAAGAHSTQSDLVSKTF